MIKIRWFVLVLLMFALGCRQQSNTEPPPLGTSVAATTPTSTAPADDAAATATPEPTVVLSPTPDMQFVVDDGVLVSEIFIGTSQAFVELYNAGDQPYDLDGHALIYHQADDRAEVTMASWDVTTWLPPHGYFLLVQDTASVDVIADQTFEALLSAESGSLFLQNDTGVIDQSIVAWGANPPADRQRGAVAPAPDPNRSLDRLPGGSAGNGRDSGQNADDFILRGMPNPQNSGSPSAPAFAESITIAIEMPAAVVSGSEFGYFVRINNLTGETLENVAVSVPFDDEFALNVHPKGARQIDDRLEWTIETLVADASITEPIYVQAPFRTDTLLMRGGFVSAESYPTAFANVTALEIEGGVIPIYAAREQLNQVVTVAGIVTANTGAFFVPDDGQQFFIEDQTGGIDVYVPAVSGRTSVAIGDQVRVVGTIRSHRGAIELVPSTVAVNVTRLGRASSPVSPLAVTLAELADAQEFYGQLITVSGTATRVEAFTHWYELVLDDGEGAEALVRIDRVSNISAAELTVGERYQVFGVFDSAEGDTFIKPRIQSDIIPLPEPELTMQYVSPSSILVGEMATHQIILSNNSAETVTNLIVAANIPLLPNAVYAGDPAQPSGNGQVAGDGKLYWGISELAAGGSTEILTFDMTYRRAGEALADVSLSAETLDEPMRITNRIFINQNVPIHVIQGAGMRSPYAGQTVTTNGSVTGIFPDLNAFTIQTAFPDDDPATSEGIWVQTSELPARLSYGDALQVLGTVVEQRGQTTIVVGNDGSIDPLPNLRDLSALEPVVLDPPIDAADAAVYYEAIEGMRVMIREPAVVVAPTNADGETALVLRKRRVSEVPRSDNVPGYLIVLDDGRATLQTDADEQGLIFRKGDALLRMIGVLAYTNDVFKIEPFSAEPYDRGITRADAPLPTLTLDGAITPTVATLNTGGLFDRLQPHPAGEELPTREEQLAQLEGLADALVRMGGPSLVALQSVETLQVLEDLVAVDALDAYQYTPLLLKGDDPLGYNNAFLIRERLLPNLGLTQAVAPDGFTRRPPLVLQTMLNELPLAVVNVHLVSAESGESTTANSRRAQLAWIAEVVTQLRADNPDTEIIVMGDFGTDWQSEVMAEVLNSAELIHAFTSLPDDAPYPYTAISHGLTFAPDGILLSQALFDTLNQTDALHIHADLPIIGLDEAATPRVFDRDPLFITFGPN